MLAKKILPDFGSALAVPPRADSTLLLRLSLYHYAKHAMPISVWQVARRLVDHATACTEFPNLWNVRINGRKKMLVRGGG